MRLVSLKVTGTPGARPSHAARMLILICDVVLGLEPLDCWGPPPGGFPLGDWGATAIAGKTAALPRDPPAGRAQSLKEMANRDVPCGSRSFSLPPRSRSLAATPTRRPTPLLRRPASLVPRRRRSHPLCADNRLLRRFQRAPLTSISAWRCVKATEAHEMQAEHQPAHRAAHADPTRFARTKRLAGAG
jgi:hypothetical protein